MLDVVFKRLKPGGAFALFINDEMLQGQIQTEIISKADNTVVVVLTLKAGIDSDGIKILGDERLEENEGN